MILLKASLRYLLRHPGQTILSIIGVALGVAVVVAIDLANGSAERAFAASRAEIAEHWQPERRFEPQMTREAGAGQVSDALVPMLLTRRIWL